MKRLLLILSAVVGLLVAVVTPSTPAEALPITGGYADPVPGHSSKSAQFLANSCSGHSGYGGYPTTGVFHTGTDWPAPVGTAVYAIASGKTKYATSWGSGFASGVHVLSTAGDGTQFAVAYGHLKLLVGEGQSVSKGQKIGTLAAIPSGSHLHFGIHPGWNVPSSGWGMWPCSSWTTTPNGYTDPLPYLTKHPLTKPSSKGQINKGEWVLTNSLNPEKDTSNRIRSTFGGSGYVAVVGDWDGNGTTTAGVFQPSTGNWVLTNSLHPESNTGDRIRFQFGSSSYVPVIGNWDGHGGDTPGLFQPSTGNWVLTNSLHPDTDSTNRVRLHWGSSSYTPVAGNWDGYRGDNPGLFQRSTGNWILTNSLNPERNSTDRIKFQFGSSTYLPVTGNWDGHGGDNAGLFQPSTGNWVLTNSLHPDTDSTNRVRLHWGSSSYLPIAGNWDGYQGDNPGLVR